MGNLYTCSLAVNQDKIENEGQDSYLSGILNINDLLYVAAVFDGCGGSGSKSYRKLGSQKGAFIASRVDSEQLRYSKLSKVDSNNAKVLTDQFTKILHYIKNKYNEESSIASNMLENFPSTACIALSQEYGNKIRTQFLSCGDSRGYILDAKGLHQITKDDTVQNYDAFESLMKDPAMSSNLNADNPFALKSQIVDATTPCIILTATDGCFDYIQVPMEFEYYILATLEKSNTPAEWKNNLTHCFRDDIKVGDDFSLCMTIFGFYDFQEIKKFFYKRFDILYKSLKANTNPTLENLQIMWDNYKFNYEHYNGKYYTGGEL